MITHTGMQNPSGEKTAASDGDLLKPRSRKREFGDRSPSQGVP
jgi:hypothetical protein